MKVLWIVNHGVNYSHLFETDVFDTKREAIAFYESIKERAARIVRWTDEYDNILAERKLGIS